MQRRDLDSAISAVREAARSKIEAAKREEDDRLLRLRDAFEAKLSALADANAQLVKDKRGLEEENARLNQRVHHLLRCGRRAAPRSGSVGLAPTGCALQPRSPPLRRPGRSAVDAASQWLGEAREGAHADPSPRRPRSSPATRPPAPSFGPTWRSGASRAGSQQHVSPPSSATTATTATIVWPARGAGDPSPLPQPTRATPPQAAHSSPQTVSVTRMPVPTTPAPQPAQSDAPPRAFAESAAAHQSAEFREESRRCGPFPLCLPPRPPPHCPPLPQHSRGD